jgi:hypothetical protein
MLWPFEYFYGDGFRPRVASVVFPTSQGPEALIVEVHMVASGLGPLGYFPAFAIADYGGTRGAIGGVGWSLDSGVYEVGSCKNPAVAVSSDVSNLTARILEVHENAADVLFYREGTLIGDPTASNAPTVNWEGVSLAYPGQEQGENPAIAIYGQTIIEFHESVTGAILSKVGQLLPEVGVDWGPSQPYADEGANPAVAIDPATGNGIEVHESRTNKAQLFERAFVVRPDGGTSILDAGGAD